ncbi:MAG TPA: endonuclease/exonuclease/phosphatase family protein [Kofleriaceae bacterium]|nr:endonuclease/exonuclease/phosphatase family protein [Kofleriaceae bacterium]
MLELAPKPSSALSITLAVGLAACGGLNHAAPRDRHPEVLAQPARSDGARGPWRVVAYNIHGVDGDRLARAIGDTPALRDADLLLLSEVHAHGPCSDACVAGARLGMASAYAPGHRQDRGTEGVAILSRWPLSDVEVIELPYHGVVVNSARRVAVAATAMTGDGPVRVYAVHLDNRIAPSARVAQLAPVLERTRAWPGPVVIGGDFNTSPFSWIGGVVPVPTGRQHGAVEAAVRRAGLTTPVTGSGATSAWLSMRLDAIYTRGVAVRSFGVSRDVRISDHLPLWADVELGLEDVAGARSL